MKKRVTSLQDEVTLLQNDVDRLEERLAAVESWPRSQQTSEKDEQAAPGTIERPRLKVIRLEPGASSAAPQQSTEAPSRSSEDADESRPVIRGTGDRIESDLPSAPGGGDHG